MEQKGSYADFEVTGIKMAKVAGYLRSIESGLVSGGWGRGVGLMAESHILTMISGNAFKHLQRPAHSMFSS